MSLHVAYHQTKSNQMQAKSQAFDSFCLFQVSLFNDDFISYVQDWTPWVLLYSYSKEKLQWFVFIGFIRTKNEVSHLPWSGADLGVRRKQSKRDQYLFTALTAMVHVFPSYVNLVGTAMGLLRLPVGLLISLVKGSLTCKDETYVKNISILSRPT